MGEGEEKFAPSLFRFSPSPFPPETPDTQARSHHYISFTD